MPNCENVSKYEEVIGRLKKLDSYIKSNNIKSIKLEKDLYYQDKLLAEKGWYVLDMPPQLIYRATQIHDELMLVAKEGDMAKFYELISGTLE